MSNQFMINCNNLNKTFIGNNNKTEILKSITMQVNCGEFLMLTGPSGGGKTTLISIIGGILRADSGTCIINGYDYSNMTQEHIIKFRSKNIGFIFQSYHLISTISIVENVALPLIINGVSKVKAINKALIALEEVGLGDKFMLNPNNLSGGQQQRVAIARSFIHNPKLLICDEPTSALDAITGEKIVELMKKINKSLGSTFIIVTHDNRIFKYADRILFLDEGMIKEGNINQHSYG